jgi:hypothetical protein
MHIRRSMFDPKFKQCCVRHLFDAGSNLHANPSCFELIHALDADPDPAIECGSDWIRIHNNEFKCLFFYKTHSLSNHNKNNKQGHSFEQG